MRMCPFCRKYVEDVFLHARTCHQVRSQQQENSPRVPTPPTELSDPDPIPSSSFVHDFEPEFIQPQIPQPEPEIDTKVPQARSPRVLSSPVAAAPAPPPQRRARQVDMRLVQAINDRAQCQYCGRKFATNRIEEHERICVRSTARHTETRVFDSRAKRLRGVVEQDFGVPEKEVEHLPASATRVQSQRTVVSPRPVTQPTTKPERPRVTQPQTTQISSPTRQFQAQPAQKPHSEVQSQPRPSSLRVALRGNVQQQASVNLRNYSSLEDVLAALQGVISPSPVLSLSLRREVVVDGIRGEVYDAITSMEALERAANEGQPVHAVVAIAPCPPERRRINLDSLSVYCIGCGMPFPANSVYCPCCGAQRKTYTELFNP